MSIKRLTKEQISKATALELTIRMNQLHMMSKTRPKDAGTPVADIREALAIDAELRRRLKKLLPHSIALKEMFK